MMLLDISTCAVEKKKVLFYLLASILIMRFDLFVWVFV